MRCVFIKKIMRHPVYFTFIAIIIAVVVAIVVVVVIAGIRRSFVNGSCFGIR